MPGEHFDRLDLARETTMSRGNILVKSSMGRKTSAHRTEVVKLGHHVKGTVADAVHPVLGHAKVQEEVGSGREVHGDDVYSWSQTPCSCGADIVHIHPVLQEGSHDVYVPH